MKRTNQIIIEQFRQERDQYVVLGEELERMLKQIAKDANVPIFGIEQRVKSIDSLERKVYRGEKNYHSLEDLTDLLGARIICHFGDHIDLLGKLVEERFEIDWERCSDKRALMQADKFGYLSLHYICSLKKDAGYPEELTNKKFEIQIRTILQHAWAVINHDLGYKSEFGTPKGVIREFARLAGLLEIADDAFITARDHISEYTGTVREQIIHDEADEVGIDLISLREYMLRSPGMSAFLQELAQIEGSEIADSNPDNYINQLRFFDIDTIGKLKTFLARNRAKAMVLAERTLGGTGLDILASNVALRFLCQAELMSSEYTEEQILGFVQLSVSDTARAARRAKYLMELREEMNQK